MKVKRLLVALVAVLLLFSTTVLFVSANDTQYCNVGDVQVYYDLYSQWSSVSSSDYSWNQDTGVLVIQNSVQRAMSGFSYGLLPAGYVSVPSGYYFTIELSVSGQYDQVYTPTVTDLDMDITVFSSTGLSYHIGSDNGYWTLNGSNYSFTTIVQVGNGEALSITRISITARMSSPNAGASSYTINNYLGLSVNMTPEQQRHQETINKLDELQQEVTDKLDQAINEDFGYQTPEDITNIYAHMDYYSALFDYYGVQAQISAEEFKNSLEPVKADINASSPLVWGWVDYLPQWFLPVIICLSCILIGRRIVK